ncbi:MAG: proline racemase [Nitrososphaeria archaeon]|nr:proline racemase [Nitrososphaeria archaeon]
MANIQVFTVDTHTGGEPTRIIISYLRVPGRTMAEKRDYFQSRLDHLRRSLIFEPRGHRNMFCAVLLDPVNEEADLGVLFMHSGGYMNMCGHGSIGVVTAALETRILEPKGEVVLDTSAGPVRALPEIKGDKVKKVTIRGVPSFLYKRTKADIPGVGEPVIDIAYGGNFFVIVEAEELGLKVKLENLVALREAGMKIRCHINDAMKVRHPIHGFHQVDVVQFSDVPENPVAHKRNVNIFGDGSVDRSPGGTGTSAKMAALYAAGHLKLGEKFIHESILGLVFEGKLVEKTKLGDLDAVIPEFTGCAYITGTHRFIIDDEDPFKFGFLL